jgi:hypothetical protein
MHEVSLTADLLAQSQAQRGKLHPFERLDVRCTALDVAGSDRIVRREDALRGLCAGCERSA